VFRRHGNVIDLSAFDVAGDQAMWRLTWGALDDHIRILELETPELRARLDRLREPPSPTPMREMVKAISKLPT
jgi:hypothetical protein